MHNSQFTELMNDFFIDGEIHCLLFSHSHNYSSVPHKIPDGISIWPAGAASFRCHWVCLAYYTQNYLI